MMERTQILGLIGELKLFGMRSAYDLTYDEVTAAGIKWQHKPPQIVGDLLNSPLTKSRLTDSVSK